MNEKIIKFSRGPFPKKYRVTLKNKKTGTIRHLVFGDSRYAQYKDRTPLGLYTKKNHNNRKRMSRYYNRHSGTKTRREGIKKEKKKAKGFYTPKLLSHIYLW